MATLIEEYDTPDIAFKAIREEIGSDLLSIADAEFKKNGGFMSGNAKDKYAWYRNWLSNYKSGDVNADGSITDQDPNVVTENVEVGGQGGNKDVLLNIHGFLLDNKLIEGDYDKWLPTVTPEIKYNIHGLLKDNGLIDKDTKFNDWQKSSFGTIDEVDITEEDSYDENPETFMNIPLNKKGLITASALDENSNYNFEDNEDWNKKVVAMVKAGTHAYNPNTRELIKLENNVRGSADLAVAKKENKVEGDNFETNRLNVKQQIDNIYNNPPELPNGDVDIDALNLAISEIDSDSEFVKFNDNSLDQELEFQRAKEKEYINNIFTEIETLRSEGVGRNAPDTRQDRIDLLKKNEEKLRELAKKANISDEDFNKYFGKDFDPEEDDYLLLTDSAERNLQLNDRLSNLTKGKTGFVSNSGLQELLLDGLEGKGYTIEDLEDYENKKEADKKLYEEWKNGTKELSTEELSRISTITPGAKEYAKKFLPNIDQAQGDVFAQTLNTVTSKDPQFKQIQQNVRKQVQNESELEMDRLREKYNLSSQEGLELAQDDLRDWWNRTYQEKLQNNPEAKKLFQQYSLAVGSNMGDFNLDLDRSKNSDLAWVDEQFKKYGKKPDSWEGQWQQGKAKILETFLKLSPGVNEVFQKFQLTANNAVLNTRDKVVDSLQGIDDQLTLGEARKNNKFLDQHLVLNDLGWVNSDTVGEYRKRKEMRLENVEERAVNNFEELTQAMADQAIFKSYSNDAAFGISEGFSFEGLLGTVSQGVEQIPHMLPSIVGGVSLAAGVATGNPALMTFGYTASAIGAGYQGVQAYGSAFMDAVERKMASDPEYAGREITGQEFIEALKTTRYDIDTGVFSAPAMSGASVMTTEFLSDVIGAKLGGGVAKSLIKKPIVAKLMSNTFGNYLAKATYGLAAAELGSTKEYLTEGFQSYLEQGFTNMTAGEASPFTTNIDTDQMLMEAAMGKKTGYMFGGGVAIGGLAGSAKYSGINSVLVGSYNDRAMNIAKNIDMTKGSKTFKTSENAFLQLQQEIMDDKNLTDDQKMASVLDLNDTRNAGLIIPQGVTGKNKLELIELLKEKAQLNRKIKAIDDSDISDQDIKRRAEVSTRIKKLASGEVVSAELDLEENRSNVRNIINKASKGKIKLVDLQDQKAVNKFVKDNKLKVKLSGNEGSILQNTETGEQTIVINRDQALKGDAVNVAGHEFLHAVLFETINQSPETALNLGNALDGYLGNLSDDQIANSKYKEKLERYKDDSESITAEEKLTLFSDALATGDIKFDENVFTQLGDQVRRFLQSIGINVKFNTGRDVYNFIKDFNNSISKGELNIAQENLLENRAEGELIADVKTEAEAVDIVDKASKSEVKNIDKLATEYQEDPASADIENLVQQYRNLALKALGYDIGKGDVKAQEAVSFVDKYFNSILNRWDPAKGKLSTHITANIKPKRQGFYESEIGKKAKTTSIDDARAQQVADTEQAVEFDQKEKQDTGRKKVYASQTDQVGDLDTAETKAIIKDEVSKDILLAANKGKNAADTARDIANESKKNYFKRLRKDIGTFASQKYKDFVNSLDKNFIKSLPVATIKRRFGKLFGIKQTGTTPTKQTSKTGKPSYFNKPVYNVPKVTAQGLQDFKDYFLGGEKRQQSLYNILATDFALESIQELMADKAFMKKLDTALSENAITAQEFMQNIENKLDGRTVENTSFDTVKASKGETVELVKETGRVKVPKSSKIRVQFSETKNGKELKKLVERNESGEEVGYYKTITDLDAPATELSETYVTKNEQGETVALTIGEARDMIGNTFIDKNPKLRNILKTSTTVNNKSLFGTTEEFDRRIPSKGVTQLKAKRYEYNKLKRFDETIYDYITGKRSKFKNEQAQNKKAYIKFWMAVQDHLQQYPQDAWFFGEVISDVASAGQNSILRYAATMGFFPVDINGNPVFNKEVVEEHSYPQVDLNESMLAAAIKGKIDLMAPVVIDAYMQGSLLKTDDKIINVDFKTIMPANFYEITAGLIAEGKLNLVPGMASIIRMSEAGINLNLYKSTYTGQTIAEYFGVGVDNSKLKTNKNVIALQNKAITSILTGTSKAAAVARFKVDMKLIPAVIKQSKALTKQYAPKLPENATTEKKVEILNNYDTTITKASKSLIKPKGISVFDFDDTLAKTKEKVIVTKANGSVVEISAAKFAEQASELQEAGATFNFDNFENVGKGTQKGPLADLALRRQGKFGSKDIFVLTARPQIAAADIKTFLDGIGLNLPLKNITGLENGSPQAKADWVISKTAEGYNDFYFADDAIKNVKAVKEILDQVDVKSDVQLVKASKGETFDKIMNDILEDSTGIKSEAEYSKARAQTVGAKKGRFTFFTTPSAEDFVGLIYKFIGKGKVGDAQLKFFQDNLIDPYNRAEQAVTRAKISAANDFKALKKSLKTLPKSLSKQTGIGGFTFGQAARVAVWTRQGMEVPGLSKRDAKELNDFVSNNAELDVFVDELINIQKGKPYPKPGQNWLAGNITSDIVNEINKVNRKEYMQVFNENLDIIFSDKVMNKLEAAYGPRYVEALRDMFRRMKSGSNRPVGNSRIVDGLLNWLNNSVGAIMFLNTRTAVLQTLSSVNFINFGNNNIIAAGKAFANQKQYWKDFMTLMNSPYLVERRDGLKINVSESEIADAVSESSNKPKAFLNLLLSKGFVLTRIADSFAIAAGGSTFYRNQIKAYMKSGMDQKVAEKQAFDDFYAVAETNQQSSNPSKISQQQASGAGRVILAFANTPMQYARIIKRASQDLIAGRGDWKTNVSKIVYYSTLQNLIFNALQNALFALAFGEEDEEQEDKTGRIANGMADSLLRGLGIQGAAVVAIKDALITIYKQSNKEKGAPEFRKAISDLFGFSPPLDSKVRKLNSGLNTLSWEREKMSQEGFNLNNPAYLAYAQVLAGLTNIPLDRAIQKINNLRAATSDSSAKWQKVALLMGWSTWDLGLPYYGVEDKEVQTPQTILRDKVLKMKKETSTKEQKEILLELGLTKQEIKALKYENERIKKIIELQK
jgi:hypothetical protein